MNKDKKCPICFGKGLIQIVDSLEEITSHEDCDLCGGTGNFNNKIPMNIQEYEEIINKTSVYPKSMGLLYTALGLCGESGEVAEKVKKLHRDNKGVMDEYFKQNLIKELGDVIWYVTASLHEIDSTLEECMEKNYEKLINRRVTNTLHGDGDNREVMGKTYDL